MRSVTALGRLEPKNGVVKVAGPSQPAIFFNVISELRVAEGDFVEAGAVLAVLDSYEVKKKNVARLEAELEHKKRENRRFRRLHEEEVVSESEQDLWATREKVAMAQLEHAKADLEHSLVRAPSRGNILKIHTYPGERVEFDGDILELGNTEEMYAVAEVYENDIGRVRVGRNATITSPAFEGKITGTVERIGWKVGKMDVLYTDPAAKTDARVVEVRIRLHDSAPVARFTNLQVEVTIEP